MFITISVWGAMREQTQGRVAGWQSSPELVFLYTDFRIDWETLSKFYLEAF